MTSNPPTHSQVMEASQFPKQNNTHKKKTPQLSSTTPFRFDSSFQRIFAECLLSASHCAGRGGKSSKEIKFLCMWPVILVSSLSIKVVVDNL